MSRSLLKTIISISIIVSILITYSNMIISKGEESNLILTPKPETNNIYLKWTGPENSSYKVYQKKPGATEFETIGLTDFSNNATDEEVKVLNIYPTRESVVPEVVTNESPIVIPQVTVTYKDRYK